MATARENLPPQVVQRVARELRKLVMVPLDGIRYLPQDDEHLTEIHVEIRGPENTPYDGGFFKLKLVLADGFPNVPPKGLFLTKIFHPNIATNGDICVNTLKKDWSPTFGIAHVLQVIRCLLIVPFPESSLNDEAGRLFMDSYDEYARRARIWTNIHAPKQSAASTTTTDNNNNKCSNAQQPSAAEPDNVVVVVAKTVSEHNVGVRSAPVDNVDAANRVSTAPRSDAMLSTPAKLREVARNDSDALVAETPTISAPSSSKKRTLNSPTAMSATLKKKQITKKKSIKRL